MPRLSVLSGLHHLRRRVTFSTIQASLSLTERLGTSHAVSVGHAFGRFASLFGPWRTRLERHMNAAGLNPSTEQVNRYFRLLGHWIGRSTAVFHRGFADSGVDDLFELDDTSHHLKSALDQGRGAILVGFHYHCHELACAAIARRFPVVALVREVKDEARNRMKRRWYESAGIETVLRSRQHSSKLAEALDFLWVLRENKILAITPDVFGARDQGVAVPLLGRSVNLPAGMIALAMGLGCPVVYSWPRWIYATDRRDRLTVRFGEPRLYPKRGDRSATLRRGMLEWAAEFESFLRRSPETWMFWLDKQWSRIWRESR